MRVSDIAKVELAAQQCTTSSALDGKPSATLAVFQSPDANALGLADSIQQKMQALSQQFPPGLRYTIVYNATDFVRADIDEILRTLAITLVLVTAVVYVFLQDWRATLIPVIAIPVSVIGVVAVLYVLGYSANTVNLFAIVLAITLVVDDAIVVVENVTRHLEERPDQSVVEATEQAMAEITGPVAPCVQRSCRLNRIGTPRGADSRKWLDTDKRTGIGLVARLLPPESSSIDLVSRDVGISVATLERWRADALAHGFATGSLRAGQRWRGCKR